MSEDTSTPGAAETASAPMPLEIGAVIAENKTLSARCVELEADNSRLGLVVKKLESAIVELTQERDQWAERAALAADVDTMPVEAPAMPAADNVRDLDCTALGRHVAGCDCTGDMRGPIAHVKQRSHDDH